ncbi:hypothetical protein ACHAQH_002932 [Verticillium albo-atrum]
MSTTIEAPPVYTLTAPRSSTSSTTTSLPAYTSVSSRQFTATVSLKILSPGKPLLSLPGPPAPRPIPVHDTAVSPSQPPKYISLRTTRCSGTATLVRGDNTSSPALATTAYRFGPGRPPTLTLHAHPSDASDQANADADADAGDFSTELTAPTFSRATTLSSPVGRYRWRYPSRGEKADLGHGESSLLLLERLAPSDEGGKDAREGRLVGYLSRRKGAAAGEGGDLQLDLTAADDGFGYGVDEKKTRSEGAGREVLELVAVASCIAMLKREVDRLRLKQGLVLAGAAGAS